MKIIRQAEIYAPDFLGTMDIFIVNDKIVAIEDEIFLSFS